MKKLQGWIVVFLVFALFTPVIQFMEPTYSILFPDLSDRALANIESVSNIAGLVLAIAVARIAYKRITTSKKGNSIDSESE